MQQAQEEQREARLDNAVAPTGMLLGAVDHSHMQLAQMARKVKVSVPSAGREQMLVLLVWLRFRGYGQLLPLQLL